MTPLSPILLPLTLVGALLAGCTLEPAYQRPALPTPNAFRDAPPPAGGPAVEKIGWRDFFIDPKLRQVVELGLANNRDLRVAIGNIDAARAQYRVQRAELLPTIALSASAAYGRQPITSTTTGGGVANSGTATAGAPSHFDEHQYSTSVGVSGYELDLFGRVRSLSKAALEQYFSTEEARRASQIAIISEIAADYLTLASDRSLLTVAKNTLASSQASLELTQKRFNGGVASELDVDQAQGLVQQSRADVASQTALVGQDRAALELVIGAPAPDTLLPDGIEPQPALLTALQPGLPSEVLLRRPDVLEAEHTLKSQNARIGAARAAFFPSISLTGSTGFSSSALSNLFRGPAQAWSFAPSISLPLFTGGANTANLAYARAEQRIAVAQYEKAIQSAFRDVSSALARRATIDEQIAADEAAVQAAQRAYTLAEARYERGADTYLNALIAQRTLYAAQQALVAARLIRASNIVALYTALGGGVN